MKTYATNARARKGYRLAESQPDLFAWASAHAAPAPLPETLAIRTIGRRFGVPVHLARAIAENASIGGRE